MPRAALLAVLVACGGCSDPAEFRPAKGVSDYPATKDAYRIQEPGEDCVSIGVVHADGDDAIADIAVTAARHGGTHYVVRGDADDPELVSHTVGTANHGVFVATTRGRVERNRRIWAQVYRCAN